jgi:hypothetical protein
VGQHRPLTELISHAVGRTSIVAPITAVVGGPTLVVASALVYRQADAHSIRTVAVIAGTSGVALCAFVVLVGLFLVAVYP